MSQTRKVLTCSALATFAMAAVVLIQTLPAADKTAPGNDSRSDSYSAELQAIRDVGSEGKGAKAAQQAVKALANGSADTMLVVLEAFEGASPLAINYLRGVVETLAQRHAADLPIAELVAQVEDKGNDPRARTLAFELIDRVDQQQASELVPAFLNDPSPELRRRAVQQLIDRATAELAEGKKEEARATWQKALVGAVDKDQVETIVDPLKELGVVVSLPRHFGFLMSWQIVGPFDNREGVGFDAVYSPEKSFLESPGGIDLQASYSGKDHQGKEQQFSWQPIATAHDYGIVDIADQIHPYKGAVMYATAEYVCKEPQNVEIRLGTPNAWKIWVNGKLAFAREEYHRGMTVDQYKVPVQLKAGRNLILLKILQNEQEPDWAQRYQYQVRVSDQTGVALLPMNEEVSTPKSADEKKSDAKE